MIIATYKTKRGATIQIDDRYMAPRDTEDERRIIEAQRRIATEILRRYNETEGQKT